MSTPFERLKSARKKAGFRSARAAALESGWKESTVRAHEAGSRGLNEEWAKRYGRRYRVQWLWLLHGDASAPAVAENASSQTARGHSVPLFGYVGAGAEIHPFEDPSALEQVEAPGTLSADGSALQVHGDSQLPAFADGDLIFYDRRRQGADIRHLIGLPCVVQVHNGPLLLKRPVPGARRHVWTLLSHNAEPILDQQLEWAAFVEWHRIAQRPQR